MWADANHIIQSNYPGVFEAEMIFPIGGGIPKSQAGYSSWYCELGVMFRKISL
jgi:hypothetical protein